MASDNEWSVLREVILGSARGFESYHVEPSFVLFFFENLANMGHIPACSQSNLSKRTLIGIARQLVEELEEDLAGLEDALVSRGVIVHRPVSMKRQVEIASPFWASWSYPALNIRDLAIVIGDTIVETAPHVRGRIFENDYLKPILYEYFNSGSRWISMPRPALTKGSLDYSYYSSSESMLAALTADDLALQIDGLAYEIVIDGANCVRLGRDILVNVGNSNHELGLRWLEREFPQYQFHALWRFADNHVDSIICALGPGRILLRSSEYTSLLPTFLHEWEVLIPPADAFSSEGSSLVGVGELPNLASGFIDMNVLSLDEKTVVVNSLSPRLCEFLSKAGYEVVPVRHRHRRLFAGGFHCFTLDTVRGA
ncbi:MAG TPA: hypothetical protein VGW40_10520 [Allosphingosinicella sp.]|nr:hypothetical protein [Allosphingosinicella sp.]